MLARRIRNVVGTAEFVQIYVYTDLHEPGVTEKDENVQVTAIPMPANFFDHDRCYGRLLSFKDSLSHAPNGPRVFIDLDMVPGPSFAALTGYRTAFLYQRMVETQKEQINGGLMVIDGQDLADLSEEFARSASATIAKYSANYIGSDQAVISGFVEQHSLGVARLTNVKLMKDLKFNLSIPREVCVVACSGQRNPFSLRSRLIYPFLNFN